MNKNPTDNHTIKESLIDQSIESIKQHFNINEPNYSLKLNNKQKFEWKDTIRIQSIITGKIRIKVKQDKNNFFIKTAFLHRKKKTSNFQSHQLVLKKTKLRQKQQPLNLHIIKNSIDLNHSYTNHIFKIVSDNQQLLNNLCTHTQNIQYTLQQITAQRTTTQEHQTNQIIQQQEYTTATAPIEYNYYT